MPTYVDVGLVFSLSLVIVSLYLLRRHSISSRSFLGWFLVGAGLALVFGVPTFLPTMQRFLGTQILLSSVVFAGAVFALSMIFYQQWKLSDSENKIRSLASEVALLRYRVDESSIPPREERRSQ